MQEPAPHFQREKEFWDGKGDQAYVSLSEADRLRLRSWIAWDGEGLCLDLGAGSGMVGRVLDDRAPSSILGLDISHRLLRHSPNPAVQGDALRLPFASASFSLIVAAAFMHHLPGLEATLMAEAFRVLRPGGRIVGYDPSADCLQNAIFMGRGRFRLKSFSPDEMPIRPQHLAHVASDAGFGDFRFERFSFRNERMTLFEAVQRYALDPIAIGPLRAPLLRWFFWGANKR
jgi:SAM-dependent methyltransferase